MNMRYIWFQGMWVRVETTEGGYTVLHPEDGEKWLTFKKSGKKIYGAGFP